ncbi:ATP phosphoribosyltransferase regulatory subunit HisZ [Pseudomonas syringae pv. actinidiae]|uniref:ATP phosphoribosyltransferase regulatory subunit HisZ n=1 Tax=Pseudomonas syringae pv. actinidiae TaxID=103796 RepID=A0A2V0Q5C7_PSESF|nr:ATP phosphoribosyltransferase regulatory subunit HisZ [Pseudomonas syringae pv. actinidiae]
MRCGAATATLIERNDSVQVRVKIAAAVRIASRTRATVNEHHRQPFRRTAFIDVEHMRLFHGQIVPGVGFDLRVQSLHKCSISPVQRLLLFCHGAS